jgi:hypothetical protein
MDPVTLEQAVNCDVPDTSVPVIDDNGSFAMKYYQPGKIMTQCSRHDYIFMTFANINMTWILPEHVQCILDKRGGCCGQRRPGVFSYANAADTRRWTNRGGR